MPTTILFFSIFLGFVGLPADDTFSNRQLFGYNLDGRGVADMNHFGGLTVNRPNDLKLPTEVCDAIAAKLSSKDEIDKFLSKASSSAECLVVYVFLNQKYPERRFSILESPFALTMKDEQAEFQGASIKIKTEDGEVEVVMTTAAFSELLKAYWRDFLLKKLD